MDIRHIALKHTHTHGHRHIHTETLTKQKDAGVLTPDRLLYLRDSQGKPLLVLVGGKKKALPRGWEQDKGTHSLPWGRGNWLTGNVRAESAFPNKG